MLAYEDIEIDTARFELRRRGQRVDVEPRVLDLIVFLATHAPRVVSRDELLEGVWRGLHVGDAALSRAVREARRALGDDGTAQRIIKTVHGRGYRFVAPMASVASERLPAPSPPSDGFYGREGTLERLIHIARGCLTGPGTTVIVTGEAGIGKTRLLERLTREARELGLTVATGRCSANEGAPAFWPWAQILRGLTAAFGEEALAGAEPSAHATVVRLLTAPPRARHFEDPDARFELMEAVGRLLAACSERAPLLLALDDVHAADSGSRAMATWLERELQGQRVVLLLTGRAHHMREQGGVRAHRLELAGLDRAGIGAWLNAARGGTPSPSLVERLASTTRGNPLHIHQLLWSAGDDDLETALAGPLPDELQEAIRRRVDEIPEGAREVLDAAAAAGVAFTAASVAAGLGRDLDAVLPLVEQLLDDGWLRRSAEVVGCLELPHAAIRTGLYDALAPAVRAQLHARMGQALIAEGDDPSGEIIERIAYHLTRAPAATRIALGIEYAQKAALEAFHKGAFDRSAAHCVAALDAMGLVEAQHGARREVALLLAAAKGRDGDLTQAAALFRGAARVADRDAGARPSLADHELVMVRESFAVVAPRLEGLVEKTYERLFERRPEVRALFRRNRPDLQVVMLAETLTSILEHYEDTPWLHETLSRLGRGHLRYGVTEEMFEWLGDALLDSLEEALGDHLSPVAADAWARAYRSIAAIATGAMRDATPRDAR